MVHKRGMGHPAEPGSEADGAQLVAGEPGEGGHVFRPASGTDLEGVLGRRCRERSRAGFRLPIATR